MLRSGRGEAKSIEGSDDAVVLRIQETSDDKLLEDHTDVNVSKKKKLIGPTKVLFLDGIRGLAAMLVVLQHSHEYLNDVNVGAIAVDAFFVLSSFLLTMLFLKKGEKLVAEGASFRKWVFTLIDYFMKRFFRVYPFFALVAVLLRMLPFEYQKRYFLVETADKYDLYKVLTFDFDHRYLMLWTLPLEIAYYFFIPMFVLGVIRSRRFWWAVCIPLQMWVVYDGLYTYRSHHTLLRPHFTTFLQGSLAAAIFVKFDSWREHTGFEFHKQHVVIVTVVEYAVVALLISESFRTLFYDWVHNNFVPVSPGDPFISSLLAVLILIEMVLPSSVSTTLEWNVLRYWGKISFSVYLLHPFILFSETISQTPSYYGRFFSSVFLLLVLASASYNLVEYPLQLAVQRLSQKLAELEATGLGVSVHFSTKHLTKAVVI